MARYTSQWNLRTTTIYTGNVQASERYGRSYDIAYDLIQRRLLPIIEISQNQDVLRKAPFDSNKNASLDIEQCRTIPPFEHSALSLTNRYSGRRLDGRPGEGALYVASLPGLIREHAHYATRPKPGLTEINSTHTPNLVKLGGAYRTRTFVERELSGASPATAKFHVYGLRRTLRLADLRTRTLFQLFAHHLSDPNARTRCGISADTPIDLLSSAITSPSDYSASRGMGDAVSDMRARMSIDGI